MISINELKGLWSLRPKKAPLLMKIRWTRAVLRMVVSEGYRRSINLCFSTTGLEDTVSNSFIWKYTKEGHDFWSYFSKLEG